MQLVARVEKVDPPAVADICAAAARAVVTLVSDPRAGEGGEWAAAISDWQHQGRIRKLVRRARGANWQRAQEPVGVTCVEGSAEVRAYVPCPMDQVPDAVAKLQIQSSPLEPAAVIGSLPNIKGEPTMVIAVAPEPPMSWGKQAAQSAHAAQVLWRSSELDRQGRWQTAGSPIQILHPDSALWHQTCVAPADGTGIEIRDGGFTEVAPGTHTASAWWAVSGP